MVFQTTSMNKLVQNFVSSTARRFKVEYFGLQWLLRAACIQSAGTGNVAKQTSGW